MPVDPENAVRAVEVVGGAAVTVGPAIKSIAARMFGPSLDAIGAHLGERVQAFLNRNAEATVVEAAAQIQAAGLEPFEIPLRTAVRLIESAAREDDDALRSMWASLMANAATSASG